MNDVNDIVIDTTNDAATWCRFTIADERCQWQIRRLKLRFDDDALIWWMMSMILWMIRRITLLPHADSPLLMNDANDRCGAWNWDLMLMLWSDEWCQWYCDWYDECRCYLMQIHHCWWTMPMTDTTNKAEIWCWCSDLMNDVIELVIDTTNDAATWCGFTIADERCQWQMRRIKLRFDADALIWWMMPMIVGLIRRMMLLPHADSPLLMNDANDRCDAWN